MFNIKLDFTFYGRKFKSFGNINIPNNGLTGEMIMSLVVMAIMLILCIVIAIASRKTDPFRKPKGIMFLAEFYVDFIDNMVVNNMGPQFKKIAAIFRLFMHVYFLVLYYWNARLSSSFDILFNSIYLSINIIPSYSYYIYDLYKVQIFQKIY